MDCISCSCHGLCASRDHDSFLPSCGCIGMGKPPQMVSAAKYLLIPEDKLMIELCMLPTITTSSTGETVIFMLNSALLQRGIRQ